MRFYCTSASSFTSLPLGDGGFNMKIYVQILAGLISSLLLLTGCTPNSPKGDIDGDGSGIISNRAQNTKQVVVILKLQSPALLSSVTKENGKSKVDADLKKQIEAEQKELIDNLKKLSSEISVLYTYKLVLNAIAVVAPVELLDTLKGLGGVVYTEGEGGFAKPKTLDDKKLVKVLENIKDKNSVTFIGADKVHKMTTERGTRVDGTGLKVGIIDTGIDYTHAMLGGPGTVAAYKAVDPAKPNAGFPNKKVVGGIDLVGTEYNSASASLKAKVPQPDSNPLDEAGHGTHVAGTVAGIGDNVNTYDGVAPGADLYAIKVFGANGSTGDAVIIAALEYAANPSANGDISDQLDVVNLSLGSPWGSEKQLYGEAIRNLVDGGTVVVASAGNEGPNDFITGAPASIDEAISVAASVDGSDHNWQFNAVKFLTPTQGALITEAIEAPIGTPLAEAGNLSGKLVAAGLADADYSDEMKALLKGQVAFIDRGRVTFAEKIKRAEEAGAIGVVVANNQPGEAFSMGGEGKFKIPAIMITQALGATIKDEMKKGDVVIQFQTPEKITKPELIDTLAGFSSKGPRTSDGALKPEISAPGQNVISAAMGEGNVGVQMSGTSMAGPHIAGVMALLKQAHPELSPAELKSILMGRATSIGDKDKNVYPLSRQGSGRVQVYESAVSSVVANRSALSLGSLNLKGKKLIRESIELKSLSAVSQDLKVEFESRHPGLTATMKSDLTLATKASATLKLDITLDASKVKESTAELDGWIKFKKDGQEVFRIPVLAVIKKISEAKSEGLTVYSSAGDSAGASADLKLKNAGTNPGEALVFNLLGFSQRKTSQWTDFVSKSCDLQAAGYRIVEKNVQGQKMKVLQVAVKLYQAVTSWQSCEVSVLIDTNGDELAEQELAGSPLGNLKGVGNPADEYKMTSILMDAAKTRELRKAYELAAQTDKKAAENYASAVLDLLPMTAYGQSTVAIVEADVTKLARRGAGSLAVKIATTDGLTTPAQMDDYLHDDAKNWKSISLEESTQTIVGIPESISLQPGEERTLAVKMGFGVAPLLVLYPQNANVFSDVLQDGQAQIIKPQFSF